MSKPIPHINSLTQEDIKTSGTEPMLVYFTNSQGQQELSVLVSKKTPIISKSDFTDPILQEGEPIYFKPIHGTGWKNHMAKFHPDKGGVGDYRPIRENDQGSILWEPGTVSKEDMDVKETAKEADHQEEEPSLPPYLDDSDDPSDVPKVATVSKAKSQDKASVKKAGKTQAKKKNPSKNPSKGTRSSTRKK